jgi:GT2 family glycosyltransferase
MSTPEFSVVICSIDRGKYDQVTALYGQLLEGTRYEIIGIHDARSLAEGYNRGTRNARGDLLIFSHDDIDIASTDLPGALARAAARLDVIGVAGTSKTVNAYWPAAGHPWLHGWVSIPDTAGPGCYVHVYGVDAAITPGLQALDGMFFAVKRAVLDKIRFDEGTFDGFHVYDVDFSFSANHAGFQVGTSAEIAVIHASRGNYGPAWDVYRARFAEKHRDRLPAAAPLYRPWSFARILVPSKADIVRRFPLERLVAITEQLRARAEK